jgi:hypothetical protein
MRFLKITATDLIAGYVRGDRQNWNAAAMTVIQSIDQMHITWTTTASAYR